MQKLESLAEIADNYDAFILDIWGVIHDGQSTYPGVVKCMQKLASLDKQIIFLSNAPRRSSKVSSVLAKFGIVRDMYLEAISSGEVSYLTIEKDEAANSRFVYIGPEKDRDLLDGLDLTETENVSEASFVVATGFDDDDSTIDEKLPQVEACLKAGLKMYCANPDLLVVRQDGTKMLCAGVIGDHYRDAGGEVIYIGKPYTKVYETCLEKFGNIDKSKILAVGDNLDTDILGGNDFGIDTVLCLGGVLKNNDMPLAELMEGAGAKPSYTIEKFNW